MSSPNKQKIDKIHIAYLMHGARNVGGGEHSLYYLIKNLRKDVFDPIVFYSNENEIVKRLREDGIQLVNIPLNGKITSVYRDMIKKNPISLFIYLFYIIAGTLKIARSLKKYKIDILHPHDNLSKIIGGGAAKITRVKVVAHCRDLLTESLIEKTLWFFQLLIMDRIITVSESTKNLFKTGKKVPDKVQTIFNGIDLKEFDYKKKGYSKEELGIWNKGLVIGIIGVFDKCKGHIYLFKAMEMLISEGLRNIACLVIGDGRERDELEAFIVSKNLQGYIKFLDYRTDIPEILQAMDVVVMPSLQESFGRVAVEAMAMKVPVIASRVGGLSETINDGKTGILVPPGDAESLSKAIRFLLENPEIRRKMGEAGRRCVEQRFSIENNVRKTEELYLQLLRSEEFIAA